NYNRVEVTMDKLKNFFAKIKSIKNIEIYVACVLAVVVLLVVLFSNTSTKSVTENPSSQSYIDELEHKIVSVVQKIDGVGKVVVAITHDDTAESVYAYQTQTNANGGESNSIISVKGEPLVVKTLPPKILGVVVVAEGADNAIVRYKINEAVVTLLNIDKSRVQVFTYKS
ncbi:MAG: hypothetical protein K2M64_02180, partial [Clostridia bacterium]|nr:hypothetical protein [Clostridia bacterium]